LVNIVKSASNTKIISLISIFAALYAVLRVIPTVPMIGASGASFSLSDIVAPLYGLILGPYIGGLSVMLGTFLAMFGKPPVFMGLDFLPGTVAAISLGLLIKRKWASVVMLNMVLFVAFLLHPNTSVAVDVSVGNTAFSFPFAWVHIVAFTLLLSPLGYKATQWFKSVDTTKIAIGLAIMVFAGTMMQHLMGNLLFETIMAQPIGSIPVVAYPGIWTSIFFVYPIERLALVALATIVGIPLLRTLKNFLVITEP
jgi:uncharacterized membrane protein